MYVAPRFSLQIKVGEEQNQVPIVFCADENYCLYLPVVVQSVIENSSFDYSYHIIILDCGVSCAILNSLRKQLEPYGNFTLHVVPVTGWLEQYSHIFEEKQHLTKATYGRLLIPQLCHGFDRVIYADIDMVFNRDIAELMSVELADNYIAAVVDLPVEIKRIIKTKRRQYIDEVLGIREDSLYVNTGLLVFNIKYWRELDISARCIDALNRQNLHSLDQDAINSICKGRVTYLDQKWNCHRERRLVEWYSSRPGTAGAEYLERLIESWLTAYTSHKSVIHFTGTLKPWLSPEIEHAHRWWIYCRKTEFYEEMLRRVMAASDTMRGIYVYSFLNIPLVKIKATLDCRKYEFFGIRFAKVLIMNNRKAVYILGLRVVDVKIY